MARNGSGVQSSPAADYPAVASTLIESAKFNNVINDINTGITGSIAADGQTTITANLPMNSKKFTGLLNGSARTDSIALGQVQDGTLNWVAGGGTADAITATYSPAITALVDGQICFVRATAANATTTPTFAPNGLTARTIVKKGGVALVAGDIEAVGHELILRYLLASTRWELLNPASGSFTGAVSGTRVTSTVATGTAPLVVASTTVVANLKSATANDLNNTAGQKLPDIDVTQATGALTVACNAAIYQDFRSTTLTDGTPTTVLADPADLVLPDGATLGSTTTVAADIAVLMINNAGTAEFAVVNLSGGVNLDESGVISTTLIDTASDSAGVVYSTTARSNVAYKVVKKFTAVNTAGAWDSPSSVKDITVMSAPRRLLQTVTHVTGNVLTGAATIPFDDTVPQITEGDQYLAVNITPGGITNLLEIDVTILMATSVTGGNGTVSLFKGGAVDAIAAISQYIATSDRLVDYTFKHIVVAGTTSTININVRAGHESAGTTTINGIASARKLGGVMASRITVKEYLA